MALISCEKMDLLHPTTVEPRRAQIPAGNNLLAEIYGVDKDSYFYIGFMDKALKEMYKDLYKKMISAVRGTSCMLKHQIQPGVHCIVEFNTWREGIYSRAKVLEYKADTEVVRCRFLDDYLEADVPRTQVYRTNEDVLEYSEFVLKCKLEEMDCFLNHPFLKTLYEAYQQSENRIGQVERCRVKVLDPTREVPTVRIRISAVEDMTTRLQEYIPNLGTMQYPKYGIPSNANLVYVTAQGKIWFQHWDDDQLIHVVNNRLQRFNPASHVPRKVTAHEMSLLWKQYYFVGAGVIFVVKDPHDNAFYRAQLKKVNGDGTCDVYYIDYGHCAVVDETTIYPAHHIDPNLTFIPSQCLPVQFLGTDEDQMFDIGRFWKYIRSSPVYVVLHKKMTRIYNYIDKHPGSLPQADVLIRAPHMSGSQLGYSLYDTYNYSPPQQQQQQPPTTSESEEAADEDSPSSGNGNSSGYSSNANGGLSHKEDHRQNHHFVLNPMELERLRKEEEEMKALKKGWVNWIADQLNKSAERASFQDQ